MSTQPTLVRSISIRNLTPAPTKRDLKAPFTIGSIVGIVTGVGYRPNKFDPSVSDPYFVGSFRAIDSDGNVTKAGTAYLPAVVSLELVDALDGVESGSSSGIEFAFNFALIPSEVTPVGYTISAVPLTQGVVKDPLDRLIAMAKGRLPNQLSIAFVSEPVDSSITD